MKENDFSYFCNRQCQYFPCHEMKEEDFNCLFCYCPLYALGENCGGNFEYIAGGIKDCSKCFLPHDPKSYFYILSKYEEVAALAAKME